MMYAVFLNVVFCTTPSLDTCMPPQHMYTIPAGPRDNQREKDCKSYELTMNLANMDSTKYYKCSAIKGN